MYAYSNLKDEVFTEILGMVFGIITVDNNLILMKYGFNIWFLSECAFMTLRCLLPHCCIATGAYLPL